MSELKAILATPHPKMKNACDGAIEVYPKSEADKVIDHHKYKRCLAMAEWCDAELLAYPSFGTESPKEKWWQKWHKRWLELAEKFKEGV